MLPPFDVTTPNSLDEAVDTLKRLGSNARVLAGGTDLLLDLRTSTAPVGNLLSLKNLKELKDLQVHDNGELRIGALVSHRELENSDLIKNRVPILHDGVSKIGSVQTRIRGTIGGNICNALPSADTAAPLLALNAAVQCYGPQGRRQIPIKTFYIGPGKSILKDDELLTHVVIPPSPSPCNGAYLKFTLRAAMDLALLGVAVFFAMEDDKKTCRTVRIALASAAPTPIRCFEAESVLEGQRLSDDLLTEAGKVASGEARPRTSWRTTAEYRRELIRVLVPQAGSLALKRLKDNL